MSRAELLAFAAGVLAAHAIAALAAGAARRPIGRAQPRRGGGPAARLAAALARLARRAGLPLATARDLHARMDAAGLPGTIGTADVAAVKAGAGLAGLLAGLPLAAAAPGRLGPLVAVALPAGAFLAPDAWLARRARRRREAIALEVADVLDLLRVAVAAGLAPARALAEVGRRRGGLLAGELAGAAARVELGVPRGEAYARLAARCPLPAVAGLTAALERADRHGASLTGALHALALDARAERARALQLRAARAAPKIQLVVALLLVPAVLMLVAGALLHALA